ncbi:hypothetical protein BH10ACI2_BH10ACI2_09080 [soil metagenome]
MSREVINVNGENVVVREDTAKAFRGVNWALVSIGAFVFITALLFVTLYMRAASDGPLDSPSNIQTPK